MNVQPDAARVVWQEGIAQLNQTGPPDYQPSLQAFEKEMVKSRLVRLSHMIPIVNRGNSDEVRDKFVDSEDAEFKGGPNLLSSNLWLSYERTAEWGSGGREAIG